MAISIGNKQSKASIGDKEVKTLDVDFDDVVQRVYNIDEDFSYDGEVKQIPIKGKGKLALKVRGGMGNGGRNPGYAEGVLNVKEEDENLFVRVGGNGSGVNGGWNGGGEGNKNNGGGGGGATDIRIKTDSVYARVIVAGGSGGKGPASNGGSGGGPHGGRGNDDADNTVGNNRDAGGGSQTQGGTARSTGGNAGTFGSGGNASGAGATGGGGGGRYGGGGAYDSDADADGKGGGGGSGYVHTAATAVNYPAGCLLNESHYLENAVNTKGGNGTGAGKAAIQGILKRGAEVPTYITQPGVYHNPTLGLISISADGQSWITISDKNVGATVADPEDINSNGDIFQYGNIHHFAGDGSGGTITVSNEIPDLTGYEGGNLYSDDKYRTNIDWNVANKNLWKGIAFNLKSLEKGPCPLGFHVPSAEEWTAVMDIVLELAGESFSYDLISKYLLMAHPNSRKGDGEFYTNNTSIYLTNSYIANQNKINAFVMIGDEGSESGGLSAADMNCGGYIRPFRDEAIVPTTGWTKLPSGSSQYWIDGYYEMVEDKWYADAEMTQEIEPEEFKYYRYIRYNTPVFYQYINGHFVVQKKNETSLTKNEAITLSEGNTRKEFTVWNGRGLGVAISRGSAAAHLLKRNDVNDVTIGNVISISSDLQYLYNGFHTKTGRIIAGDNGSSDNNRQLYYIDLDWNNNSITKSLAASNGSGAPFQGNMVDDENVHAYAFDNGSSGQYLRVNMNDTGSGFKSTDGIKTTTTFSNICGGAWHDGRIVVQPDNNSNVYFGTPIEGTDTIEWTSYTHGLTRPNSVGSDRVRNVYVGSSTQSQLARGRGTRDSMSWSVVNVALNTGGQIYVDEIGDVWYGGETATGLGRVRFGEFMTAEEIIAKQTPLYDIVYEDGNFKDLQQHELIKTGNISVGNHYWRNSANLNKMLFRFNDGESFPNEFTVMWFARTNGSHRSSDHPVMVALSDSINKVMFGVGFTQDNSKFQLYHLRENDTWDVAEYVTSALDSSVRHHYTMTRDGSSLWLRIDGTKITYVANNASGSGSPAPIGGLSVFGRYVSGYETESARSNCFNGDLYDVKCFGRCFNRDDILSYLKSYGYRYQNNADTKISIPMADFAVSVDWSKKRRAVTPSVGRGVFGGVYCATFGNQNISINTPFLTRNKNTTFCVWLYCTGVNTGDGKIFDIRNNFGATNGRVVYTYNSGSPTGYGFYGYRSDSTEANFFEGVARLNQWLCYCVTFDENNIPTMYLKGAGVDTKITGPQQTNLEGVPPYMNIGNEYNNPSSSSGARRFFNGGMSRLIYEHRNWTEDEYNRYYDKTKWIFGIS